MEGLFVRSVAVLVVIPWTGSGAVSSGGLEGMAFYWKSMYHGGFWTHTALAFTCGGCGGGFDVFWGLVKSLSGGVCIYPLLTFRF